MPIDSHNRTKARFDTNKVASEYPALFGASRRDRREVACLRRALDAIPRGSNVLDLPCGSGRLLPLLLEKGARVTGADYSQHMLANARCNWETVRGALAGDVPAVSFVQCDALQTGFADGEFDAVVCHRLLHHFSDSPTRVRALRELSRISSGPVIVSFFNAHALDAVKRRLINRLRRHDPTDRIPISPRKFRNNVREAGLRIVSQHPVWRGISPLCILVLEHEQQQPVRASERNSLDNAA